jgi:hypothetical protein
LNAVDNGFFGIFVQYIDVHLDKIDSVIVVLIRKQEKLNLTTGGKS